MLPSGQCGYPDWQFNSSKYDITAWNDRTPDNLTTGYLHLRSSSAYTSINFKALIIIAVLCALIVLLLFSLQYFLIFILRRIKKFQPNLANSLIAIPLHDGIQLHRIELRRDTMSGFAVGLVWFSLWTRGYLPRHRFTEWKMPQSSQRSQTQNQAWRNFPRKNFEPANRRINLRQVASRAQSYGGRVRLRKRSRHNRCN